MQVFAYKMCNFSKKVFQCPPIWAIFSFFQFTMYNSQLTKGSRSLVRRTFLLRTSIWCIYTLPVAFIVRKQQFPTRPDMDAIPDIIVIFAIFFFLSFNAPHPMRVLFVCLLSSFAARPLHPPRLADRAALSFPPFVERSYSPGDTIAPSHPLTHSPTHPLIH